MERNDFSNVGRGSPRKISVRLFLNRFIGLQEEMAFNGFSIFSSGGILFSGAERFSNFCRGSPRNMSVKLFFESVLWSRRLKVFFLF